MTQKIDVQADTSAVKKALDEVEKAAKRVNDILSSGNVGIDVSAAEADLKNLNASAERFNEALKQAGKTGNTVDIGHKAADTLSTAAQAAEVLAKVLAKVGRNSNTSGIGKAAKDMEALDAATKRAARAQEILNRERIRIRGDRQAGDVVSDYDNLAQSGARGTGVLRRHDLADYLSGGWRNYSISEDESRHHRDSILQRLGLESEGAQGVRAKIASHLLAGRGERVAGALGGIAGGMLGGGDGGLWGTTGGAAGSLIGAGAGALVGGPAGMMVGGVVGAFASRLLGGIGGSLDQHMGNAVAEGGMYSDLKHSLGATSIEFDMLRGSVRHFTDGLGITYNEAAKLAKEFAHIGSLTEKDGMNIGRELGGAIGFGRGYGIAPEQSASFFALMRHYQVSGGESDNRRLALMIGDAVARGHSTAKMDEVLGAVSSFVSSATRQSLTGANVGGFVDFLSSMTGLPFAGLKGDPGAAAGIMGRADAALRQGGAFGDASRSFRLGIYQRLLPDFTALDMDAINEQGAFGTLGAAFGPNSPHYRLAERTGDHKKLALYKKWASMDDGKSMLEREFDALEKYGGGSSDGLAEASRTHLGMEKGQAVSLWLAMKGKGDGGTGFMQALKSAGIDSKTLDMKQASSLAALFNADRGDLEKQARRLQGIKLSKEDAAQLSSTRTDDELRTAVLKLTEKYDKQMDSGEAARKTQADMNNALQEMASKMIPMTMTIKDGIVEIVRRFAGDSEFVKQEDARRAKEREESTRAAGLDRQIKEKGKQIEDFKADPEKEAKARQSIEALKKSRAEAAARGDAKSVDAYDKAITGLEREALLYSPNGAEVLQEDQEKLIAERNSLATQGPANVQPANPPSQPKNQPVAGERPRPATARPGMMLTDDEKAYLAETDKLIGAKPGTSEAQIKVESGNDPNAVSRAGAWGLAQLMPSTKAAIEKRMGRKIVSRADQLEAHRLLMQENVKRFGNVEDAQRAYNSGLDRSKWGNKETSKYVPKIEATRLALAAPEDKRVDVKAQLADVAMDKKLPPGAASTAAGAAGPQKVAVSGEFFLKSPDGHHLADPIILTSLGAPPPAGTYS